VSILYAPYPLPGGECIQYREPELSTNHRYGGGFSPHGFPEDWNHNLKKKSADEGNIRLK